MPSTRASVLIAPALILALFAPVLGGEHRPAFRDVSHFYTPLYDYLASRCQDQWLPLWNPLDQTGVPLLGETTSAVLYPVRVGLYAVAPSSETALAWYLVIHLLLASVSVQVAARWAGVSRRAAAIAGLIYPLSGSVLFLYTNPPFLVGAAWMPLVVGAIMGRERRKSTRQIWRNRSIIAAVAMAMMILGGDPLTALNSMIVGTAFQITARLVRTARLADVRTLIFIPLLAALLSVPQLVASISWSRQSERLATADRDTIFRPPVVGSQRYQAYQFSLAPWHLLEIATPNAFGLPLPQNARLSRLIPGDGRMWTPTIYLGMFAAAAILIRLMTGTLDRWCALAATGLCLALGHFGAVWWIQAATPWLSHVDSAAGGPYWFLYHFVPGYDAFRYPAKWLPFVSLGLAISAGGLLDVSRHAVLRFGRRLILVMVCLAVGLVVALGIVSWLRWDPTWKAELRLPTDEFWGPLDCEQGLHQIAWSIVHSLVVLAGIAAIAWYRAAKHRSRDQAALLLTLVAGADLSIGLAPILFRVNSRELQSLVAGAPLITPDARSIRTSEGAGWPASWTATTDQHRLEDVEASQRLALFGKWHLAGGITSMNPMVSIQSRRWSRFWSQRREQLGRVEPWPMWLGLDGELQTDGQTVSKPIGSRESQLVHCQWIPMIPGPLVQCHPDWRVAGDDLLTESVNDGNDVNSTVPIVESDGDSTEARIEPTDRDWPTDVALPVPVLIRDRPEDAVIDVRAVLPTLLTRPVYQDGHWRAIATDLDTGQPLDVVVQRVNQIIQGIVLPPGNYRVRFLYRPWWLTLTVIVWVTSWILLCGVGIRSVIPRRTARIR